MPDYQCHRRLSRTFRYAVMLGAVALSGCVPQHKDAIIFGVTTTGGVKVGVDEKQVPTVIVGYNRQEAAFVPLFVYGDGMFTAACRNLDTTNYLELAKGRFEKAEAEPTGEKKTALFQEGLRLVKMAYEAASQKSSEDSEVPKISPGLEKLHKLAVAATVAEPTAGPMQDKPARSITEVVVVDPTTFKLLTEAEIQRPSTAVRYLQEYKYISEADGQRSRDAYSVLGTFTGSAKGTAKPAAGGGGVEASGSIAQYFATGLAAQNLSRSPAAVSGNAEAVRAASEKFRYQALTPERREEIACDQASREEIADEIISKLTTNGTLDVQRLKALIGEDGRVIKGAYKDEQIDGLAKRPSVLVRSSLTGRLDIQQLQKVRDAL